MSIFDNRMFNYIINGSKHFSVFPWSHVILWSWITVSLCLLELSCKPRPQYPVDDIRHFRTFDIPEDHINNGFQCLAINQVERAERLFNQAMRIRPFHKVTDKIEHAPALAGLGFCSAMQNDFEKAHKYIEKAKLWNKYCWQAYMVEAIVLVQQKPDNWLTRAEAAFRRSLDDTVTRKDKATCHYWWARSLFENSDYENANRISLKLIYLFRPDPDYTDTSLSDTTGKAVKPKIVVLQKQLFSDKIPTSFFVHLLRLAFTENGKYEVVPPMTKRDRSAYLPQQPECSDLNCFIDQGKSLGADKVLTVQIRAPFGFSAAVNQIDIKTQKRSIIRNKRTMSLDKFLEFLVKVAFY